jgi:hypothetical protein
MELGGSPSCRPPSTLRRTDWGEDAIERAGGSRALDRPIVPPHPRRESSTRPRSAEIQGRGGAPEHGPDLGLRPLTRRRGIRGHHLDVVHEL